MNFRNKPVFSKDDGAYKIVDDFRKIKLFEVDCSSSARNYKSSLGNIRQSVIGNSRLVAGLNGEFMTVADLNHETFVKSQDFSCISKRLSSPYQTGMSYCSDAPFISTAVETQKIQDIVGM